MLEVECCSIGLVLYVIQVIKTKLISSIGRLISRLRFFLVP